MTTQEAHAVVVAVDGGPGCAGALRYAVDEALRRGERLHVVHVWPSTLPGTLLPRGTAAGLQAGGCRALDLAAETAGRLAPGLEVDTELVVGPRAAGILSAARCGRLVVVGRQPRNHPAVELMATPTTVAARAECPTVVVPSAWTAERPGGVIVVGMKSRTHARELLSHAFGTAHDRGARIVVVTAWELYDPTMDRAEARSNPEYWEAEGTRVLEELVAEWRERYPVVPVELRVVHGRAAKVLVREAAQADLLLVGRRQHTVPPYGRLGSTSHAVLLSSETPVEVVPAGVVADAPDRPTVGTRQV
jgi:nucleotide-binding universal stress UspA family protein